MVLGMLKSEVSLDVWADHLAKQRQRYANLSMEERAKRYYPANRRYRARNKNNPVFKEKHRVDARQRYRDGRTLDYLLNKKYGISKAQYQIMLEQQDGVCKICLEPNHWTRSKTLAVDHDHRTGRVRGLLCNRCNLMLGKADDDIGILHSAIEYLKGELN